MDLIPSNVFCSFISTLPEEFQVDSAPIEVQTTSNNENLSELISHLLEMEDVTFEFLVNGEFLRGNLKR